MLPSSVKAAATSGLRIAYLVTTLTGGGAERQVVDIACRLAARGHQVLIISMTAPDALIERLGPAGVGLAVLGMRRGRADLGGLVRLAGRLRRFRPDVLHTHLTHANILGRLARLFVRLPRLISTIHSTYDRHRWSNLAYRLTDGLCDLTSGVSRAVVDRYTANRAVARAKIVVVYNGVDLARFRAAARTGPAGRPFVWCAVGRLTEAKDYPGLLRAMAELRRRGWGVDRLRLRLAGEGELRPIITKLRDELGLGGRREAPGEVAVELTGEQTNLPAFLAQADAFVLSSAWEGFGLVLAEAMAAGLPVVATDCGGTADILDGGRLGPLVPPGRPALLADAMEALVKDYAAACQLNETRQAWVSERFSFEAALVRWEALYRPAKSGR